ncbi:hypothetical protein BV20DRAFT_973531 [Pilatotrama ljubarskyi]|nr:hypothetical protein BV20DRAFT_973531 [Pilatotrama ljubarskyi]
MSLTRPKLSFDVCEHIISSSRSEVWNIDEDARNFRTFCLVCRAWLSCSRRHLWRCISLSRPSKLDAVIHAIEQDPSLATLIVELDVSTAVPFNSRQMPQPSCFLAFGTLPARFTLTHLRTLRLYHLDFRIYPLKYYQCFARATSVTRLEIDWAVFQTVGDLLRLVWAFRNLESLQIKQGIDIRQALEKDAGTRFDLLCKSRASRFCMKLRDVDFTCIYDPNQYRPIVLPPASLGASVKKMRLEAASNQIKEWLANPANIQRYLFAVSGAGLAHLSIDLRLDLATLTTLRNEVAIAHGPVITLISTVQTKSLRTLTFDVTVAASGVQWNARKSDTLKTALHAVLLGRPDWYQPRLGLPCLEKLTLAVTTVGVDHHVRCVVTSDGRIPRLQALLDAEWRDQF